MMNYSQLEELRQIFGPRLLEQESLAKYTSARIGGPADTLLVAQSADDLAEIVTRFWMMEIPFEILGGGSNILVSDAGVRGTVIINKARKVVFDTQADPPTVWAESGSNFGVIARQAAQKGLSGLEWAGGIPGTIGGAVFGNAGAHGSEIASNLKLAEILHRKQGRQKWTQEQLSYTYRSSILSQHVGQAVILSALLELSAGNSAQIEAAMDEYLTFRRRTQPPGATMGSMFKNPPDDFAGRLIEAAGLKSASIGGAQISPLHANFFINTGNATAQDVFSLIRRARQAVKQQFNVSLDLEIRLFGDWPEQNDE
ncbi:MAG: UDP-N-acetylmuramate dehydrogenase [Anaerolineae bacterium]|nr:UDP-N-acetylmuramate dehydrogenase [Anaerolineae bacterium]